MKPYFYLAMVLLGMSIMPSCNKDDAASTIEGEWKMVKREFLFKGKVVGKTIMNEEWLFREGELVRGIYMPCAYSLIDNAIRPYSYSMYDEIYWKRQYYYIEELGKSSLVLREPVTTTKTEPPSYVHSYDYDSFTLLESFEGVNIYRLSSSQPSAFFYIDNDNSTVIVDKDYGFGDFFFDSYRYHFTR